MLPIALQVTSTITGALKVGLVQQAVIVVIIAALAVQPVVVFVAKT